MTETILQTKLTIPPLRPNLVARPHLSAKLSNNLQGKLTLVSAPAGFGKTTLVRDWVAGCSCPVAWISLGEDDGDPVRFLTYFIASLQTVNKDLGRNIIEASQSSGSPPIKTSVGALVNEIGALGHDITLVLDDYHLVKSEAIHDILTFLLEHQPHNLHLVITSREDPPIPLPRLRARGQLAEIREADLRFSEVEAALLFNEIMGLNLTEAQIAILDRKTEGWVSGLLLAALSLRGQEDVDRFVRSFSGSNRFILDYLMEEVFKQQTTEVRDFLLRTAVLEEFNASLCAAVAADGEMTAPRSQILLEWLEQTNLFIVPLDDSRAWFRYHHLFADLLRQRLRQEGKEPAVYHLQAAIWHEKNGFPRRAVNHYLAASAWDKAAVLILELSDKIVKHGENVTFLNWTQALPDAVTQAYPELCLEYAWALALSGQPDEAEKFLDIAQTALHDQPQQMAKILSARIHVARIRQDVSQTITLSQEALTRIPPSAFESRSALSLNLGMAYWQSKEIHAAQDAFSTARELARRAENHHIELLATGFRGLVEAAQGRLSQAAEMLQSALARESDLPANALPYLVQGALLYEWNQLEAANDHLQTAIALAQRSGNSELESSAHRQYALLMQTRGDLEAANMALGLAEEIAGKNAPPFTRARNQAAGVYLALAQNDLDAARRLTAQMQVGAAISIFYTQLFLAPARLHLALGDKQQAQSHLAAEYKTAEQSGLRYGQIEILLLQVLAASDPEKGLDFLARALNLSQRGGFIRIFINKGKDLAPSLHMAAARGIHSDYCRRLIAGFDDQLPGGMPLVPPSPPPSIQIETFSEREIEVLNLLAEGLTYQEIAQTMFVSVNTVKSHLKNIYGKLDVHNRREAVARARVLHLIA